ncbi:hypothetical protein QBZ16_001241 [Prototheca wickerhamii]|uniref:Vacuolar ATPase assembly protein VMA22 n=1 Tax=Prototheca wickerhamii TaxID=3111 RepID=A0AAD9IFX1_PROWI|nr:hypothetical protein QBZ16_001241 [Prototheca wickerhamii]
MAPQEDAFVRVMDLVQEYLDLQEKLGASLRDGRFFIARSRYHTGPLGVSDARIPKHMSASTGARLHEGAAQGLELVRAPEGKSLLRSVIDELAERFSCQALDDQPETEGGAQDPLRWFGGALAPHDLRKAQRAFAEALDCMVRAASLSMQIQTLCLAVDNERGD